MVGRSILMVFEIIVSRQSYSFTGADPKLYLFVFYYRFIDIYDFIT